jgi:DNA-binding beta-propeller fold protein YncE
MLPRPLLHKRIPGPRARPAHAPLLAGIDPQFTPLPAPPFAVAVSPDGARAFVSMPRPDARGLLVLSAGAPWRLEQVLWLDQAIVPRGMTTDREGRYLLAANSAGGVIVVRVDALATGSPDALVSLVQSPSVGSMQVILDPDDRFAYVTDEQSSTLSVFDFERSLRSSTPEARLVGHVRVPAAPVGLAQTADGEHLLVTSQGSGEHGMLSVLRAREVTDDPARAAVASVPAGRQPVRVVIAPEVAWVSARGSNSVLAFDLEGLIAGAPRPLRAVVRVGAAPVGLALLDRGSTVVVANSNRYGSDARQPQTLSVIDVDAALTGRGALVGSVRAGSFPRELARLPDDRSLLVTNVFSQDLEAVSVVR